MRLLSESFLNPSVRMLRAEKLIRDTHSNCESVEYELCKPSVRMLRTVRMIRDTHPNCESVECELCKH